MTDASFKPLALGAPRSGFVLLCSVLNQLVPMAPPAATLRQCLLDHLIDAFGDHIANEVTRVVAAAGLERDLIYSPAFRSITGGPKWQRPDAPDQACFRKYIGVRGLGDFTLITAHPLDVLDYDDVVHSHVDPEIWLNHSRFAAYNRFASIRNPVGILTSALLSLNALTSAYIQTWLPADTDIQALRARLALYKLTDLTFFDGLVRFYKRWFGAFLPVRAGYSCLRWEALLTEPVAAIGNLARTAGLPVDGDHAAQIWDRLAHRNLTGAHRHNFRVGGGIVGDWKRWITNRHLDRLREQGFDEILACLDYEPLPRLEESAYTEFQRQADVLLARGAVFDDIPDRTLFGFAFNKSNIDSSGFAFKHYGWMTATRVERSDFKDEALLHACWAAADAATVRLNTAFTAVLAEDWAEQDQAEAALARVKDIVASLFAQRMPKACAAAFPAMASLIRSWFATAALGYAVDPRRPPHLIRAVGVTNVVGYQGRFFGIPQAAGPLDLATQSVDDVPGVVIRRRYGDLIGELSR